jgi:hypothetical protein
MSKQTSYIDTFAPSKLSTFSKQTRLKSGSGTYPRTRSPIEEVIEGRKTYYLRCYIDGKHSEHYSIHVI